MSETKETTQPIIKLTEKVFLVLFPHNKFIGVFVLYANWEDLALKSNYYESSQWPTSHKQSTTTFLHVCQQLLGLLFDFKTVQVWNKAWHSFIIGQRYKKVDIVDRHNFKTGSYYLKMFSSVYKLKVYIRWDYGSTVDSLYLFFTNCYQAFIRSVWMCRSIWISRPCQRSWLNNRDQIWYEELNKITNVMH